ncbi:MAG: hypothetical protein ABI588_09305 [Arenimonas sp.]
MGPKIRLSFWLLTAIFFGFDFYLWGGLQGTPVIGQELMKEAPFQSPMAATYMFLGKKINGTLGTQAASSAYAARHFPELVAHPEKIQNLAVYRFLNAQSVSESMMYYGAPLLLVLSFVLHMMRQKQVRSLGS